MKTLAQIFALLLAVALPGAANAQVRLTDVLTFGADSTGSSYFQPDVWDTEPGGNWDNWLQSLPSGTFLNGPSDAAVQPNITLLPGTNSFRVYTSPGIDNGNFGINLFFNGAQTPSISAFGPMLTSADQVHSFAADSASPTPTPVPVYNSGIPGAGTLTFETSNLVITLTDFYLATPSVFNLDQASQTSLGSDGVMDYVGGFTLVVTTNTPPDCKPVPAGIVSWWKGEGNAQDAVGTNNGIGLNGISYSAGEVGQAFVFGQTNSAVVVPASPSLDVGAGGGFTLEAWINPIDVTQMHPLFEWNDSNWWGVHFHIAPGQPSSGTPGPGQLYANIVDSYGGWHQLGSAGGVVTSNVFQHVALTYDKNSGVATIYCNGQIVCQQNLGSFTPLTSYDLYLGRRQAPSDETCSFLGSMDEAAVYNRALSSAEIQAVYQAGSAGKCAVPSIVQQPLNQTTVAGAGAALTVGMGGAGPFSYQWRFNGTNISGATNSTLTLANLHANQSGAYSVVVTTPDGTLTSSDATVTVLTQTILAYNYFGTQKTITLGGEASANFSGQMFFIPAGTNGVFVGWANLNGKKQYWVTPFADYLLVTIPGSSGHVYTVLGKAGDSWDANGQPHIWAYLHQGLNTSLTVGARQKFSFPNTFTCNDTHLYPDANTGNLVLSQANSTYTFLSPTTQTANNNGQTLTDLVNALTHSLVKLGYQKQ